MQISQLYPSNAFSNDDVLAIEINGVTYKLTGATLAAALQSIGDYVDMTDLSEEYSNQNTYALGSYCIYNNVLYRCTSAITQPEDFNSAHWTTVKVMSEVNQRIKFSDVVDSLNNSSSEFPLSAKQGKALGDNRAFKFLLSASGTTATWADMYAKLKNLNTYDVATFFASGGAASLLTGGKVTSTMKGTVAYNGSGTYDFLAFAGLGPYAYGWRVTTLTGTTAGTVGTVYMYAGADTQTTGTITKSSRVTSGTLDNTTCTKKGNVVTVSGRINGITANSVSANGEYFVIPSGFRPSVRLICMGDIIVGSTHTSVLVRIQTNGSVEIPYSDSVYPTTVFFNATYGV